MGRKKRFTAQEIIAAIKGGKEYVDKDGARKILSSSGGVISTIASRLGCDWHTVKEYIKNDIKIQKAYDDELERVKDLCESTIINSIAGGDTGNAKWWLSKKAKDRGFDDSVDVGLTGDITIRVVRDRKKDEQK